MGSFDFKILRLIKYNKRNLKMINWNYRKYITPEEGKSLI